MATLTGMPFYTGEVVRVTAVPGGEFATVVAVNESPWVGGISNLSLRMADGSVREFTEGFIIRKPEFDHDEYDDRDI